MSNLKFSAYPLINCLLKRKCIIVLINTIFILCFSKNIAHHFYNNAKNYLNLYYYHPQTKYGQNYGNNKLAWVNNEATKFTYKLLKCFLDYSKEGNGYSFMHINNTANLIDVLNENDENSISADVNNDDFLKNIAIRQKTLLAASNYIQNRLVKKRTLFSLTKSGKKKNKDKKKKKKKRKIKRADDDEADYYKKKRKIYIDDDDDDDDYRRKRNIKKHKKKNKKYDDIDDYDYDYDYISDSDDSYEKIKSKKKKTKKTKNDDDDINKDNLKKKKQELEEVNKVAHELEEKKDILENAEKHMVALLTSIHSLEASP